MIVEIINIPSRPIPFWDFKTNPWKWFIPISKNEPFSMRFILVMDSLEGQINLCFSRPCSLSVKQLIRLRGRFYPLWVYGALFMSFDIFPYVRSKRLKLKCTRLTWRTRRTFTPLTNHFPHKAQWLIAHYIISTMILQSHCISSKRPSKFSYDIEHFQLVHSQKYRRCYKGVKHAI